MRSFREDYKKGIDNEKRILEILKKKFNDTDNKIRLNEDKFGFYDIIDDINKRIIEIKQRNYTINRFFDWMLPLSKLIRFKKMKKLDKFSNYTFFYIQCNLDGDYYCILNKKNIGKIQLHKRKDRVDKVDVEQNYIYLKTNKFRDLKVMKYNKKLV
jgi:hypothetical protein